MSFLGLTCKSFGLKAKPRGFRVVTSGPTPFHSSAKGGPLLAYQNRERVENYVLLIKLSGKYA